MAKEVLTAALIGFLAMGINHLGHCDRCAVGSDEMARRMLLAAGADDNDRHHALDRPAVRAARRNSLLVGPAAFVPCTS